MEGDTLSLAAIDNGLAFPYKHPTKWRSYRKMDLILAYGWASLPNALSTFSQTTRQHMLYFLTSQTVSEWMNG